MKITKKYLERIIKEEIEKIMREEKGIKNKAAGARKLVTPRDLADAAKSKEVIFMKRPMSSVPPLKGKSTRHMYAHGDAWPWQDKGFTNPRNNWQYWPVAVNNVDLPWKQGGSTTSYVYYAVDEVEGRLYVVNYDVKCVGEVCS